MSEADPTISVTYGSGNMVFERCLDCAGDAWDAPAPVADASGRAGVVWLGNAWLAVYSRPKTDTTSEAVCCKSTPNPDSWPVSETVIVANQGIIHGAAVTEAGVAGAMVDDALYVSRDRGATWERASRVPVPSDAPGWVLGAVRHLFVVDAVLKDGSVRHYVSEDCGASWH